MSTFYARETLPRQKKSGATRLLWSLFGACLFSAVLGYRPVIIVHGLFDSSGDFVNLLRFINQVSLRYLWRITPDSCHMRPIDLSNIDVFRSNKSDKALVEPETWTFTLPLATQSCFLGNYCVHLTMLALHTCFSLDKLFNTSAHYLSTLNWYIWLIVRCHKI